MGGMAERKFNHGEGVLMRLPKHDEWTYGVVHDCAERDGGWRYFVQPTGKPPVAANDPRFWFSESELRYADLPEDD